MKQIYVVQSYLWKHLNLQFSWIVFHEIFIEEISDISFKPTSALLCNGIGPNKGPLWDTWNCLRLQALVKHQFLIWKEWWTWTDVLNRIKPSHYVASLILRERVSLSLFPYLIFILSLLSPFLFSFNIFFSWNRLNLSHRIWFKLWFWFWVWLWFWFWIRIRMRQLSNNQRDRLPGWELELIIVWLWLQVSVLREREGVQHLHDGLHSSRRDPMVCHQGNF